MEWNYFSSIVLGLLIRIGIPLIITLILIWVVRSLDQRWRDDGAGVVVRAKNTGCWNIKGCAEKDRAKCSAHANQDIPCWQHFRRDDGTLRSGCIGCDVFRQAPVPALT